MILDKQQLFSEEQAITADAASTNYIDLGADASDVNSPNQKGTFDILVQVIDELSLLTSLTISVQTDDNTSFSSATSVLDKTVAAALLSGTNIKPIKLTCDMIDLERYVRLYYDVNGTNPDEGTITAGVVLDTQVNGN